jgi:hypothetical protein
MDKKEIYDTKVPQGRYHIEYSIHSHVCKVDISEMSGDDIVVSDAPYISMEVMKKYFFPTFNEEMQWYHPGDHGNDILATAEVMEHARAKALEILRNG